MQAVKVCNCCVELTFTVNRIKKGIRKLKNFIIGTYFMAILTAKINVKIIDFTII